MGDRRERLAALAAETIDLAKDPYFMRNHLGTFECKLCLTLHNNEASYLAHTQGKKHQSNLARRAAKEAKEAPVQPAPLKAGVDIKKFVKIGRPGYRVTKQRDPENGQQSLLFEIDYPEIAEGIVPRHRFMSAYEQKVEPPDRKWQYLLFAAEPYETIAFKVPSREVDKSENRFWTHWNRETKEFFLQFSSSWWIPEEEEDEVRLLLLLLRWFHLDLLLLRVTFLLLPNLRHLDLEFPHLHQECE